ncbi:MAG: hypothetical protein H7Z12_15105 [Rhodospirillaceae bacterium]|nr:hypothetical protein [Rhodospirillales bacterium]
MADDLALRVGGLETLVKQMAATQARTLDVLERVVRLEERQSNVVTTVARLEEEVRENAKGVVAGTPWLNVLNKAGGSIVTALATSVATFIAVKFGLPGG